MEDLRGKKLLILGGSVATYDLVLHAKKRGIYVIVTDYLEHGISKEIADEQYMISTSDIEGLKKLIFEKDVDGVFTGTSEINLRFVQEICEQMKLPFYATREQLDICMNKRLFKEKCRESSIPVTKEYDIKQKEDLLIIDDFPVIIKPVDGYSSRGVSVCYNMEELNKAYDNALHNSRSKAVIVEKFIENQEEVCMYYTIQNGNITLSAMTDRDLNFSQKRKAQQPNALLFPSRYISVYYKKLHEKILDLGKKLKLKNGTMFIQSFIKDDEFTVFEMGYRLCGANEYIIVSKENEINTLEMYINMALTGEFSGWDNSIYDNANFQNKYCILIPLLKHGVIQDCSCLDTIRNMKEVIHVLQFYNEGDYVKESVEGSLEQSLARIYICASNEYDLRKAIEKVQNILTVKDKYDRELLIDGFDIKKYWRE